MEIVYGTPQKSGQKEKRGSHQDVLLSPITINKMVIRNRIIMSAMHLNMVEKSIVGDRIVAFYEERARGGAGAIIAGYASINDLGCGSGLIGGHKDEFIEGLARLSRAIQTGGCRSGLQVNHPGAYAHRRMTGGKQAIAPSAILSGFTHEMTRALEHDEVKKTVQDFADTALRAKKAGFDFIEILSGTGYLISEFLSEVTNKREDEYGGSWENRMRFGLEIAAAVRATVGQDYPVIWRINGNDLMPNGIGRNRMKEYAVRLVETGADAISVNVGWHEAKVPQIVSEVPRGAYAYLSRGIKESVNVPVIAGHRINDPSTAREMISDHLCDMVAMARPLIADPELPKKIAEGREHEIIHCVGCAQACFDHLPQVKMVECLSNPRAGHELESTLAKTDAPKKVLICGGGPAGMVAGAAAARKGHEVVIYEKSGQLGGQLQLAGKPPGRNEFAVLAGDLEAQLAPAGVKKVVLNAEADEAAIDREKPDVVLLSTGAVEITPSIPGAKLPHVAGSWDVLAGRVQTGQRVAIIGGGAVGVETALLLAEKGTLPSETVKFLLVNRAEPVEDLYELATKGSKQIVLIEMLGKIGADIGRSSRWGMLQDLQRHGVQVLTNAKAKEITPEGVVVETPDGPREIPADTVVLALGARSYNPLEELLVKKGIPYKVIGDAKRIAKAFDAIHDGYEAVMDL